MARRLLNVLVAVDEGVNSLFGGLPFETISGTVWRNDYKWAVFLIDAILGKGHCQKQAEKEAAIEAALEGTIGHETPLQDTPE